MSSTYSVEITLENIPDEKYEEVMDKVIEFLKDNNIEHNIGVGQEE